MAKIQYCWRCKFDVPMLDEVEFASVWAQMETHLPGAKFGAGALARYREITGFDESNINAIWHHRCSIYGPDCAVCGKPLRTPRAAFCAACGAARQSIA